MWKIAILALCVTICLADVKRYDGYQVLRMEAIGESQVKALTKLQSVPGLDFWHFPQDLMVSPTQSDWLQDYLRENQITFNVWIEDVQQKIEETTNNTPRTQANEFDYGVYHPLDEIMGWIDLVVATYPNLVTKSSIGSSYEGRDLTLLKLGVPGAGKHAVFIEGGIHAREWVSPATVMWMTNQLLDDFVNGTSDAEFILNTYDIYMLTVTNPDGYYETWVGDRMWRKTTSPNNDSICLGTDGNRNFGHEWGGQGSSGLPCTETYRGAEPFSESETAAVANFILNEQSGGVTFDLFIDYHSYSEMVLSAWGYKFDHPEDYDILHTNMKVYADAVEARHGKQYFIGTGADLYITSGDTVDWGYGTAGIPHSYCIELRDDGQFGFLLPEIQIIPTAEENYDGLVASLIHIAST
ncbi:carboxypeptidase B-like [Glandiceps talaboti]